MTNKNENTSNKLIALNKLMAREKILKARATTTEKWFQIILREITGIEWWKIRKCNIIHHPSIKYGTDPQPLTY